MTSRISHARLFTAGVTAVLSFSVLAACSSSTSGSGSPAGVGGGVGGGSGSSGSGSSGSGSSGSDQVQPAGSLEELAATLVTSTSKATTVHLVLSTTGEATGGSDTNGEGDVRTAAGGKTEAFTFAVGSGGSNIELVYVDGTGYVKLPTSEVSDPSKPWAKISDTSSNPVIKAIAQSFDQVQTQTSLTQYATLVKGGSDFKATGSGDVDGTAVQEYTFDIDPKNLPNAADLGGVVDQIDPVPTTMSLDEQGRPVKVVQEITIAGKTLTNTVTFSDYGQDADISAPPADQISAD